MFGSLRLFAALAAALAGSAAWAGPVQVFVGGQNDQVFVTDGAGSTALLTGNNNGTTAPLLGSVEAVAIGPDGALYAAAFNYGSPFNPPPGPGAPVSGIFRYDGTAFQPYLTPAQFAFTPLGLAFAPTANPGVGGPGPGNGWTAGDLFATNAGSSTINQYTGGGNPPIYNIPVPTPSQPAQLTFNPSGTTLYFASNAQAGGGSANAKGIFKWDGVSAQATPVFWFDGSTSFGVTPGGPVNDPTGIAADSHGNIFFGAGNGVTEISAAGKVVSLNILNGALQASVTGLVLAADGMLYVADQGTNTVQRYSLQYLGDPDDTVVATIDPTFSFTGPPGFTASGLAVVVVPVPEPAPVLTLVLTIGAAAGFALRRRSAAAA